MTDETTTHPTAAGYAAGAEPWPAETTSRVDEYGHTLRTFGSDDMARIARQHMAGDEYHRTGACRRDGVDGRSNCGTCVLHGYEPREGYEGPDGPRVADTGPNYAGWARLYVEARYPIPERWRRAFEEDQLGSDNTAYADALRRSIATFGVSFA